jgi:NDP-sugar pyrophosphorylase family protein
MIAVILAAGRGTRMGALTENCPKPMLLVHGKNLIERKLEVLPKEVTTVIIIVGYLKEMIMEYFGDSWKGIAIEYVEQKTLSGTGGAIDLLKERLKDEERFMILMGDDLYSREDLEEIISNPYSILVSDQGEEGRKRGWQVFFDENKMLTKIHQEVEVETSPYINAAAYSIGKEYFSEELYMMTNGEYSLPHTLIKFIERKKREGSPIQLRVVVARSWIQITSPESIVEAEKMLLE